MANAKILIVDDEPDIVRTLSMRLKSAGYNVVTAMDAMQVTTVAIREEPDLVILDLGLPAGGGHAVAQRLRDSSKTCTIPIIVLTARTSVEDKETAFSAGVAKYITKPFKADDLLAAVEELTVQA